MKNNGSIKTIIIDNNMEAVNSLKEYFRATSKIDVVANFEDGERAYEYILENSNKFDLILMDVLLPLLDGTTLLEKLKEANITKTTIILSSFKDDKVVKKCMDYNVTYYMLKPINISALESRIYESFEDNVVYSAFDDKRIIDLEISRVLHHLGIPTHIRGYKYIKDSILLIYNNERLDSITKDIYPHIATKYETTPSRVERAIRHAIEVSCTRGDLNLIEEIFGFSVSFEKDRPTNAEYIITLAERFKIDKSFSKRLTRA